MLSIISVKTVDNDNVIPIDSVKAAHVQPNVSRHNSASRAVSRGFCSHLAFCCLNKQHFQGNCSQTIKGPEKMLQILE